MSYKILEQNGIDNENVDGGAFNNFAAGGRDGIVGGVLSECALAAAGSTVSISPGLIMLHGIRVKVTGIETLSLSSVPIKPMSYQVVAQVTLASNGDVDFSIFIRTPQPLVQDPLYQNNVGVYQAELASFTHNSDGTISNLTKTLDIIYGSGGGSVNIEVGTVTTETLDAGLDADFDVNIRNEEGTNKILLDFDAKIPRGASGTDDEAVHFTPQGLSDSQKSQARENIGAASKNNLDKALYNLAPTDTVVTDSDDTVTVTRNRDGVTYTETLPADVPLNQLDQNMTDIVHDEVEKTLNLADIQKQITINSGTEQWVSYTIALKAGTYTISSSNIPDGIICQIIINGDFVWISNTYHIFTIKNDLSVTVRFGNNQVSQNTTFTPTIMLNEGSHAYPYQPYNGAIVHEKQLNDALEDYLPLTGGTINGTINATGQVQEAGQRVYSPNNPPPGMSPRYMHHVLIRALDAQGASQRVSISADFSISFERVNTDYYILLDLETGSNSVFESMLDVYNALLGIRQIGFISVNQTFSAGQGPCEIAFSSPTSGRVSALFSEGIIASSLVFRTINAPNIHFEFVSDDVEAINN